MHRALKNFNAEQPYQHAVYYLALILTEHAWTKQELIDAVSCMFNCSALITFVLMASIHVYLFCSFFLS